jgi:hypothetical protein
MFLTTNTSHGMLQHYAVCSLADGQYHRLGIGPPDQRDGE